MALRPKSAPRTVAPIDTIVCVFCADRLLLFAGHRVRGGLHALRQAGDLRRVAVAQLLHRRVARLTRRLLHADPEVALALAGLGA